MNVIWITAAFVAAYLIGSISSAILIGRIVAGDDIRTHGSGNAGATNALRTYGKKAAAFVTLGDCLKAVAAILIGLLFAKLSGNFVTERNLFIYAASVGTILGHNFPVYFKFRGGKGILVSIVGIFFADWRIGLIVTVAAILIMVLTRYVSLGSVLGAVLFVILSCIFHWGDGAFIVYAVLVAGFAIIKHRSNILRLIKGTENKLGHRE